MRLFIAEKPSLARAIAAVLPGPHKPAKHHIECGGGNIVAFCIGHILETAPPEAYSQEYKTWKLEHLPIAPREWKLVVKEQALVKSLRTLLKQAKNVTNCGDPDREGQLLVDETLIYLGYKGPVDRVLISDMSPDAVRRALANAEPNTKYRRLYESALARQRADWLYGMNLTRLYTLLGRAGGHDGVRSVGRVQTPVLGLVCRRDEAIEAFKPTPYYSLSATLQTAAGTTFRAAWTPVDGRKAGIDEEGRLLCRDGADAARARAMGGTGTVSRATEEKRTEAPPLPYSLADLQIDAGRRLGLSAQIVLDACQALYEVHKLVTYPRSDCSYLPEGHLEQTKSVIASIVQHAPALAEATEKVDLSLRSRAWNTKKVTAHHAIIPTPNVGDARLGDTERAIYHLVCRRYLMQFYPAFEYSQTKVEVTVARETFAAHGREIVREGWKTLMGNKVDEGMTGEADLLPRLREGDTVTATEVEVAEKRTQPQKPFTDATLVQAMCNISRFVSNPNVKKILAETDGIGTPATRATIVETLFERGYIERRGKTIVSTPTGRALIKSLPEIATTADMTAIWEAALRAIHDGTQTLDAFLCRVEKQVGQIVASARTLPDQHSPRQH